MGFRSLSRNWLRTAMITVVVAVGMPTAARAAEPAPPAVVITAVQNQGLPSGPVTITGTASDDTGVGMVRLAIRNRTTLKYWSGSRWGNSLTWVNATLAAPGAGSTGWSYTWTPPSPAPVNVTALAVDDTGVTTKVPRPYVNFAVGAPADATAPETTIDTPSEGSTFDTWPVVLTGHATDERALEHVRIRVQDVATGQWWGSYWYPTPVDHSDASPVEGTAFGGTSVAWRTTIFAPYPGTFRVSAVAYDQSNNADPTPATRTFTVTTAPPDTQDPIANIRTPAWPVTGYPNAPMTFSGLALDNVAVSSVRVAIRVTGMDLWWNGSTFVPGFRWLDTTRSHPGLPWTEWSYAWTPPGPGGYQMILDVTDSSGRKPGPTTRMYRNFYVAD